MDHSTLRLLYRLSMAAVVLLFSVVALVVGVQLPFGRAGRGLSVLGILGLVIAIVLVTSRLRAQRYPGSSPGPLTPLALARAAIQDARGRAERVHARSSAALHRRRRAARVRQAERAALEAADNHEHLAPERIRMAAEALFRLVYVAWERRDRKQLPTLLSPELLLVWERALDAYEAAGEHHRAEVLGDVQIDLIGLTQEAPEAFTAIVLVEAELAVRVDSLYGTRGTSDDSPSPARRLCQYWTLAWEGPGPWTVRAIQERAEGDHHLTEPIVAGAPRPVRS